ncbi:hypothetical protein [Rhodococcus qingshengii]|uniref:hypothetical protein n=1 Tax=Rhodococcus qingshengii TaxID=334542 RepID=UPI0035E05C9E
MVKLVNEKTGEEIHPNSEVKDFRGDVVVFRYISQLPIGNSGGKIIVDDGVETNPFVREVYPSVVMAKIVFAE